MYENRLFFEKDFNIIEYGLIFFKNFNLDFFWKKLPHKGVKKFQSMFKYSISKGRATRKPTFL
jgi:hypothetical protein